MSTLTPYKGLFVLTSASGAGGNAINNDFTALADRIGPCNYTATTDPTSSDNQSLNYYVGSRWLNQADETEWVCATSNSTFATWTSAEANAAATYLPLTGGTINGSLQVNGSDTLASFQSSDGAAYLTITNNSSATYNYCGIQLIGVPSGGVADHYVVGMFGSSNFGITADPYGSPYAVFQVDNNGNIYASGPSVSGPTKFVDKHGQFYFPTGAQLTDTSGNLHANNGSVVADANGNTYMPTNTSDPTGVSAGQFYFNTSTNQLRIFTGSTWKGVTLS
jgi:hypothetical protein